MIVPVAHIHKYIFDAQQLVVEWKSLHGERIKDFKRGIQMVVTKENDYIVQLFDQSQLMNSRIVKRCAFVGRH